MNWLRSRLAKWSGVTPEVVMIPDLPQISEPEYLSCCGRIMASPDGRFLLQALKQHYLAIATLRCPKTDQHERSTWLAAHEATVQTRRNFIMDLEQNTTLLPTKQGGDRKLGGVHNG